MDLNVLQNVVYWTCFFQQAVLVTLRKEGHDKLSHSTDFRTLLWELNLILGRKIEILVPWMNAKFFHDSS
jgi:hypothetical protein